MSKLVAPDGYVEDDFGITVPISGNIAMVAATDDDGNRGSAYLFDVSTGNMLSKFIASDGSGGDYFGTGDISDNIAVVGAACDDGHGSAYIFDVSDPAAPVQLSKIVPADLRPNDWFGTRIVVNRVK